MAEQLACGSWPSPISAADLVAGAAGLSEIVVDGDDVWFSESRPEEGGRVALMRWREGQISEMTPSDVSVRTRVHEYGGGAWWVSDGTLWYVDDSDQRLRRLDVEGDSAGEPTMLTPVPEVERGLRYADGRPTADKAWFICVREQHLTGSGDEHVEPVNELVAVAGDGSMRVEVIAAGADFYSSPRPAADDRSIAWVQWRHPDMAWDSTELWVAEFADGVTAHARAVAGHDETQSIVLPGFTSDGRLLAVTDVDEWWNLREFGLDGNDGDFVVDGSFEIATPAWVFGISRWAEVGDGVVAARTDPGGDTIVDVSSGRVRSDWSSVSALHRHGDGVVFIGARHDAEPAVVRWVPERDEVTVLRPGRPLGFDAAFVPDPEPLAFATTDGEEAHGWYYRPAHPEFVPAEGELPPLLVLAHGGPTGRARTELQLALRYWTSRGFAVVDVDYRGSTGYGRTYRQALWGRWGVADVDDCVAAAHHLIDVGVVDGDRVLIKGSSAGGLTVLGALADTDLFAAGASRYGVADLRALAQDTHKFEARYCDRLVAPWPEREDVYVARSPINRIDDLDTPMIVLQGDADAVVPPNQAEAVVSALADKGVPYAYRLYPGVAHGFRDADTIIDALEAELSFFAQTIGVEPAGDVPVVTVVR